MRPHGTARRYRDGCRCAQCRQANTAKVRAERAGRRARGITPDAHGQSTYGNYGCRCPVCTEANVGRMQEYRRDPERAERLRADGQAYKATRQRVSLAGATRYGQQWTGPEMELVCRDDLTYAELAAMLGRTVAAVGTKRKRVRRGDPVPVRLAGRSHT